MVKELESLAETGTTYYGTDSFRLRKVPNTLLINLQIKLNYIKQRHGYGAFAFTEEDLIDALILSGVFTEKNLKMIGEKLTKPEKKGKKGEEP